MRPTIVKTIKKNGRGWSEVCCLWGKSFYIRSFGNGTVTFEPIAGERIYDFAKIIAGCFFQILILPKCFFLHIRMLNMKFQR